MKDLRHVIGMAMEEELITKNPFAKYTIQYINTDRGFLTQDEIDKMAEMKFDEIRLEQARDVFLFCCFTGIFYSDLKDLKKENVQLSPDGKLWINGRRVKTGVEYNIPLLNIPKTILKKYGKKQAKTRLLPVESLQTYNNLLKEIAKRCGIDKRISSHLARHTFATTIALSNGVPLETVSKMLGHTSLKTTQIYARILNSKISSEMDKLASRFLHVEEKMVANA
jgi:site-specific recombinase XerD